MRPEDFHDPAKLRSMVMHMMEARQGLIHGGREHLEHAANHLNAMAAIYEAQARRVAEAKILKSAGVDRAPPLPASSIVSDAAARRAKKEKEDNGD